MQIGMIGLGRMGASMTKRLLRGDHACVVHDSQLEAMAPLVALGARSTTTPLRHRELYQYDINQPEIAEVWRRGSVIGSWLLDLTAAALAADPALANFEGRVSDSGEGRWTIQAAIDEAVPAPVLSAALYARFSSRGEADFANRVQSAMRHEFGGHVEKPAPNQSSPKV